jgi:hypothetical protein
MVALAARNSSGQQSPYFSALFADSTLKRCQDLAITCIVL